MLALEHTSLYLQGSWATVLDSAWSGLAAWWLVHTWDTSTLQFSLLGQADFVPPTANSKTLFPVSLATGAAIVCRPPQKHTSPLQPQHLPLSPLFAQVPLQLPVLAIPQPKCPFLFSKIKATQLPHSLKGYWWPQNYWDLPLRFSMSLAASGALTSVTVMGGAGLWAPLGVGFLLSTTPSS